MTHTNPSNSHKPRRKRPFRWVLALLLVLLILVVAFVVTIEIVRRSSLVPKLILSKVQESTGFITSAGDISVGWNGSTVLEDLVFTLPLSDEPTLTIERLVVEHDSLLGIIIRRGVQLDSVRVERPVLIAREQPGAEGPSIGWSLAQALDRLLASLPRDDDPDSGPPHIPELAVIEGQFVLAPLGADRLPLALSGKASRAGDLAMQVELEIADLLIARGEAAVGGDWAHAVDVHVAPTEPVWAQVSRMLRVEPVQRPAADGRWSGRVESGVLAGFLHLERATSGPVTLAGDTQIRAGETIEIRPRELRLEYADNPPLVAREGELLLTGDQAALRGLALELADQVVNIDGRADLGALSGSADLSFRGRLGELFTHEGNASVQFESPAGRPVIAVTAAGSGETPNARVRAEARMSAAGPDWRNLSGTLELPTLTYRAGERAWDASGLALAAAVDERGVALEGVKIPNARSSTVTGQLRFEDLEWSILARLNDWQPIIEGPQFDFDLRSNGTGGAVESFVAEGGEQDVRFAAQGAYDPALPKPVSLALDLVVDRDPPAEDEPALDAAAPVSIIPANLSGAITANFSLSGTLQPMILDGDARMMTQGVRFREVVFDDMEMLGTAEFREGGGTFSSEEFSLLEGHASIVARSDWRGNVNARATLAGVDLGTLGGLFAPETPLEGRAGAVIEAELPGGEFDDLLARAQWRIEGFAASVLRVESASGDARYARGVVELTDTVISNGDGDIRLRATLPLDDLTRVETAASADEFRLELGTFVASISGATQGTVDLLNQAAELSLDGSAGFTLDGQPVATIGVTGEVAGRTLELAEIDGRIGDGALAGVAIIPLDSLAESTAKLTLTDLEPRYFESLWAQTADVGGRVNGTLVLAPTSEEHAPEPSRLDVDFTLTESSWRTVALKSLSIQAYIGEERSVLQRGVAELGGGVVTLWGATNDHDGDRYVQLSGDVRSVDLQQVVSAVAPDAERYEGLVSASFSGAGYVFEPHRLFGEAVVTVSDSDLIAIPVINELYSLFNVRGRGERRGSGIAEMRLDGDMLHIHRADYFNRGLELRASLVIADVFAGKDSEIAGMAVGTARPLAGAEIPLTAGADRMISAAQAGGTVARIDGTLGDPEAKVVPLADLQQFVSRLLGPLGG